MDAHPIDVAANVLGSQVALAAALGVTKAAVNQWKGSARQVPLEHCAEIERMTAAKVRRWHLRPNDWHRIWPELVGTEGAPPVPADQPQEVRDAA